LSHVFFTDRDLGKQFAGILKADGLLVERHDEHFAADAPDEVWLEEAGARGWIALTHNSRIRYTPNELAAVMRHGVRLIVVVGKAPYPELAHAFVASRAVIRAFLDNHPMGPWIAKFLRPTPTTSVQNTQALGHMELWFPRS
jgi:hypothetical protein